MKLLASFIASTLAQGLTDERNFDYGSFADYGLGDFDSNYNFDGNYADAYGGSFYDYDAAAQAANRDAEEDDERKGERYFFTQPTTTSTTTTTTVATVISGDSCWKCDQMSYADCAAKGDIEKCQKGDKDCCFVEIRETAQQLQQLCTGCKSRVACENLRDENFHFDTPNSFGKAISNEKVYQCRPDYRQQIVGKHATKQSVCRQCFNTCDPLEVVDSKTGGYCFGGSAGKTTMHKLRFNLQTNKGSYPWGAFYNSAIADVADGMGIPISVLTGTTTAGDVQEATSSTDHWNVLLNLYSTSTSNGRTAPAATATSVVFWGLQGADQAWWSSDLKKIQAKARAGTNNAAANYKP